MLRKPKHFTNEPLNLYHVSNITMAPNNHKVPLEQRNSSSESRAYGIDPCIDNNGQYHAINDIDINGYDIDEKQFFNGNMRGAMLPPIERSGNR